jgi:hypothetical protein
MDTDELQTVQAELLAVQAVLMSVFRSLARADPSLARLFCTAFDDAETILAGVAARLGMEPALATTGEALTVIEELRRAVIGDEAACGPPRRDS